MTRPAEYFDNWRRLLTLRDKLRERGIVVEHDNPIARTLMSFDVGDLPERGDDPAR